jgi:hypothetical protein
MMEKLVHLVRVGVACHCPPPFTISTISIKVLVYTLAERADTLPPFQLYAYMYSLVETTNRTGIFVLPILEGETVLYRLTGSLYFLLRNMICCNITEDFATAASQNGVLITEKMRHDL